MVEEGAQWDGAHRHKHVEATPCSWSVPCYLSRRGRKAQRHSWSLSLSPEPGAQQVPWACVSFTVQGVYASFGSSLPSASMSNSPCFVLSLVPLSLEPQFKKNHVHSPGLKLRTAFTRRHLPADPFSSSVISGRFDFDTRFHVIQAFLELRPAWLSLLSVVITGQSGPFFPSFLTVLAGDGTLPTSGKCTNSVKR